MRSKTRKSSGRLTVTLNSIGGRGTIRANRSLMFVRSAKAEPGARARRRGLANVLALGRFLGAAVLAVFDPDAFLTAFFLAGFFRPGMSASLIRSARIGGTLVSFEFRRV
jgi:hypothetical protein